MVGFRDDMQPEKHSQKLEKYKTGLAKVYGNTQTHIEVAEIITTHLDKAVDIRKAAFQKADITKALNILDIGCGCGYFTRGLKGVVNPNAGIIGIDLHAAFEEHYLNSCRDAGIQGRFYSDGACTINRFERRSLDLILSSYSLYFFPECIRQLSNLLKEDGCFMAITHSMPHMTELTTFIKEILREEGIEFQKQLPYERLIRNFSGENGKELLSTCFSRVEKYNYKSRLLFKPNDYNSLMKYFRFKESFFLPENNYNKQHITQVIAARVKEELDSVGEFSISKDDCLFICAQPLKPQEKK